jgi:hypothetical protein
MKPWHPISIAITGLVVGDAALDDRVCAEHPTLLMCDNPRAPGPDAPHEVPEAPTMPVAVFANTTPSTASDMTIGSIFSLPR